MKTWFPITLIIVSVISLTLPALMVYLQVRKLDTPAKALVGTLLYSKRYEFLVGLVSYLAILIGAIGLLLSVSWARMTVLTGLSVLLAYVWIENLSKISYFRQLRSGDDEVQREELEAGLEELFEPLAVDVKEAVDFDDHFYDLAARKHIGKSVRRLVVGTVLLLPAIWYLAG